MKTHILTFAAISRAAAAGLNPLAGLPDAKDPKDEKDSMNAMNAMNAASRWRSGFPAVPLCRSLVALVAALCSFAPPAHAVKTSEILLGNDGVYDNAVAIARDDAGRMTFRDSQVTSPTTLWILHGNATSHSSLSNLGADDHLQYLDDTRHLGAHSAEFNSAFAIAPDVAGNTTLGGHVGDADLHLRRDADETISGAWTFPSLKIAGDRVLTVDPNGAAEYTTIHDALAAAAAITPPPSANSRVVVQLQPGLHTVTQRETLPRYVDLVGIGTAKIDGNNDTIPPGWYNAPDAPTSALVIAEGDNRIEGLTFQNYRTLYPSVCLYATADAGEEVDVRNCVFLGGAQDSLYLNGAGSIVVESSSVVGMSDSISAILSAGTVQILRNVTCISLGTGTSDGNNLWLAGPGTILFQNSELWAQKADAGNVRFADTGGTGTKAIFDHCAFYSGATRAPNSGLVVKDVQGSATGCTLYLSRCAYADLNYAPDADLAIPTEDLGDGDKAIGGDLAVAGGISGGSLSVTGACGLGATTVSGTLETAVDKDFTIKNGFTLWNDIGEAVVRFDAAVNQFQASANDGTDWDQPVPMYGVASGAGGLSSTSTEWDYFDAVAGGRYDLGSWSVTGNAYIASVDDESLVYFPIPYRAATTITRLSVRWQGVGANDGVIVTLQKRQGGTASAAWATVGAAQTYTGTTETNSVYDLADETLAAGYAYRVVVESQVATSGARLWEIGVETGKRAY